MRTGKRKVTKNRDGGYTVQHPGGDSYRVSGFEILGGIDTPLRTRPVDLKLPAEEYDLDEAEKVAARVRAEDELDAEQEAEAEPKIMWVKRDGRMVKEES